MWVWERGLFQELSKSGCTNTISHLIKPNIEIVFSGNSLDYMVQTVTERVINMTLT